MIPTRDRSWTLLDFSVLALMIALGIWAFQTPLRDIFSIGFRDDEQSHVLLAPLIAGWLIWLRRSRLPLIRVRPNVLGTLIVAAGVLICWAGFRTDTYVAWHGGGIIALLGMVITMTGFEPIRQFAPAVAALAFLIPVPGTIRQELAIPLQTMATSVTHWTLEVFGFQVAKMGNVLQINGEQVAVAEACNGMRLVFSLTLVVYAFAFSTPLRPGIRAGLILLSPLVALVINVIRLVPTSLLYGAVSSERAEAFHDISGWLMLPVALLALVGLLKLCRWLEFPVTSFRFARS